MRTREDVASRNIVWYLREHLLTGYKQTTQSHHSFRCEVGAQGPNLDLYPCHPTITSHFRALACTSASNYLLRSLAIAL